MRLVTGSLFALLLAVGAAACGDGSLTDSQSVASQLVGTWSEPFGLPGESLVMRLATSDTVVTGTGTYTFEAGIRGRRQSPEPFPTRRSISMSRSTSGR